jgi:hypothetical protein
VGVTGPVLVAPFVFEAAIWEGLRGDEVGVSMLMRISPVIDVWEGRRRRPRR